MKISVAAVAAVAITALQGTSAFIPSAFNGPQNVFRNINLAESFKTSSPKSELHNGSIDSGVLSIESHEKVTENSANCEALSIKESVSLPGEVDYEFLFAESNFPIGPEDLIARAKQVLHPDIGLGTRDGGNCLDEDFEFVAAVVGPIGKEAYLKALGNFRLDEGFDVEQNFFGFSVDPMQPNRVWLFSRQVARHVGTFMGVEATGDEIVLPPQTFHLDFTDDGKLKEFGFYTVDRRQGNTGGLGGAFGYLYGVGRPLPIPECHPYRPSFRYRMFQMFGRLMSKLERRRAKE